MRISLPLCLASAVLLLGCGSSGGSGTSDEDQIRDLTSQAADFVADNEYGNYCELLSPAAIDEIESTEGFDDGTCEGLMALAGGSVSDSDIEVISNPTSITVDGATGTVTYEDDSENDFNVEKVDGEWKIGPSGDSGESSDEPSKAEVRAWPSKFCSIKIGMTRNQVREIMGEPTSEFTGASANQDEWDGYEVSVTAFYDIDDRVKQLDDSTGTSNLPCEDPGM